MILYHGTNTDIETIDLDKGQQNKEYLTKTYAETV